MALPPRITHEYEKNTLDRTLDDVLKNTSQGGSISSTDSGRVRVAAQVQSGIDRYRAAAAGMTEMELESEAHDSARLGRHLEEVGKKRPPKCHAHAIVAGAHFYAAELRLLMAILKIRIDDADNGCWLPENTAATPHPSFPSAPPHSRIHRFNYYFWLSARLRNLTDQRTFRTNLQIAANLLQQGGMPSYVMLPKGVGIEDTGGAA